MKSKFLMAVSVAGLVAVAAFAGTTTNRLGQVVVTDANGVVTSITDPTVPGSTTNTIIGLPTSAQVNYGTAASRDYATNYVPRQVGDILIFTAASTTNGGVFMANGVTCNDWILLGAPSH